MKIGQKGEGTMYLCWAANSLHAITRVPGEPVREILSRGVAHVVAGACTMHAVYRYQQ